MKRIAILHYASPPTVGGVETTIAYHARGLANLGYAVRVISGSGYDFDTRVETHVNPLFGSSHPEVLRVKSELDAGVVSAQFERLTDQITVDLKNSLNGCDVCLAHNIPSLHKNLPLTAALARLLECIPVVAWCHDLAWTNPQYLPELYEAYPWTLLRERWPGVHYVTVSEARRSELAQMLGISAEQVTVIVPGVDPARFFHWTAMMRTLENELCLLDADGLLLLPARLTRRKNIALALRILAEVRRQSGQDFRLIVTGPPGPHNPSNPGYLGELLTLRRDLGLDDAAHFIYTYGVPDDDTMANLYQLADALLFPSEQEGFGIPILEAGLSGLPAFCADIPPLRHTGQDDVTFFDPINGLPAAIGRQIVETLRASPAYRLRVRVRQSYRWDVIIREQIVPVLEMLDRASEPGDVVDLAP